MVCLIIKIACKYTKKKKKDKIEMAISFEKR